MARSSRVKNQKEKKKKKKEKEKKCEREVERRGIKTKNKGI